MRPRVVKRGVEDFATIEDGMIRLKLVKTHHCFCIILAIRLMHIFQTLKVSGQYVYGCTPYVYLLKKILLWFSSRS